MDIRNSKSEVRFSPLGTPSAKLPQTVAAGQKRTAVTLELRFQGEDLFLHITGGRAHVGAVAACQAPTADTPRPEPVIHALGGHREGPLAGDCARQLALSGRCSCAVVAGIHQDRITAGEIGSVLANVQAALAVLCAWLTGAPAAVPAGGEEQLMGQWCREAAVIALSYFRRTGDLEFKDGHEVVTVADREIETLLRGRITAAYPDDLIVGEEFGGSADDPDPARRVWQIDPVDGTLNFAVGLPGFCTSLALMQGDQVLAAAVYQPLTGDLFSATRGRGARLNGEPMQVSCRYPLGEAVLSTQLKRAGRIMDNPTLLQAVARAPMKTRRTGAIALEMAWVAAGFYDGLLGSFAGTVHLWDIAAGLLLVREAGGRITDFQGQPYGSGGSEMVVSNGLIHAAIVDLF